MKANIEMIGKIWMPPVTCGMRKNLSNYDIGNIRDRVESGITRANLEDWLTCNSGDFQSVDDFAAYITDPETGEDIFIAWESEESEMTYYDCMSEGE